MESKSISLQDYELILYKYSKAAKIPLVRCDTQMEYVSAIKTALQWIALGRWHENNCRGTASIATGVGKTRIGVVAACEAIRSSGYKERTLISVPTEVLVQQWPNEIRKWQYGDCLNNIVIECHASSRSRVGENWDTLIVDEAHALLSPINSKLLEHNTFKRILMLSATISAPEKKKMLLRYEIPIFLDYTIERAEEDGVVSPNTRFVLYVDLTGKERAKYDHITRDLAKKAELLGGGRFALDNSTRILKNKMGFGQMGPGQAMSIARGYMSLIQQRKDVVYYAEEKYRIIRDLREQVVRNDLAIIFSEKTDFVDGLCNLLGSCATKYHSGMKPKKIRDSNLKAFISREFNVLCAAKALNAGLDIPSVHWGIAAAGNSSDLDKTQREGRIFRAEDGKHAKFINVCCRNTVESGWIDKSYGKRKNKPIAVNSIQELIDKLYTDTEWQRTN